MTFRPTQFQLRFVAAVMLAIAIAVLAFGILLPLGSTAALNDKTSTTVARTTSATTQSADIAADLVDLMDVTLRKPLVEAHSTTSASGHGGGSSFGLRLVGTIMEPMHSYAVFTDPTGKTELKRVGDRADGADITAIAEDSVTLMINGQATVLHAIKPSAIGASGL